MRWGVNVMRKLLGGEGGGGEGNTVGKVLGPRSTESGADR